jgi:hypothetical protein
MRQSGANVEQRERRRAPSRTFMQVGPFGWR